jgi:hypothetical protein
VKITLQIANCRESAGGDRFATDCILSQPVHLQRVTYGSRSESINLQMRCHELNIDETVPEWRHQLSDSDQQLRQIGGMSVGGASYSSGVVRLSRPLPDAPLRSTLFGDAFSAFQE